jgi:hypothetical protein
MRITKGWTGLRIAVIAAGLLAGTAPLAQADSILTYHTAGGPPSTGINGAPAISFVPVQDATVDTASNISLGTFVVAALPSGASTTYNNAPFTLSLYPDAFNQTSLNDKAIVISGTLNGTVTGPFQSNVHATFNPISDPSFAIGTGKGILTMSNTSELLVPSSVNNGQTTLQGSITTSGVISEAPEPSTIALFLSTVCGLGLRRYVQLRRKRHHV